MMNSAIHGVMIVVITTASLYLLNSILQDLLMVMYLANLTKTQIIPGNSWLTFCASAHTHSHTSYVTGYRYVIVCTDVCIIYFLFMCTFPGLYYISVEL